MLEASLDTSDKGRGINSTVSEKPTRVLLAARAGGESVAPEASLASCAVEGDPKFDCSSARPKDFGGWLSLPDGVVGALPPIGAVLEGDLIITEISWQEMAADLR